MNFSLDKLKRVMPGDFSGQRAFVRLFIDEMTKTEIPKCHRYLNDKNVADLKRTAHTMKSNVAYFGLDEIGKSLSKIENLPVSSIEDQETELFVLLTLSNLEKECENMRLWCLEETNL